MDHATQLARRPPGWRRPSTPPIHVVTRRASTCATTSFAEYVANQLNQIGLTADSEVIEIAQYNEQYDINYHDVPEDRGWIGTNPHGNEIMDVSSTAQAYYSCDGGSSTYCNPELDKALDAAIPLVGEERQKALAEVTRMYYEDYGAIPIIHMPAQLRLAAELHWTPRLDGFILLKEMSLTSAGGLGAGGVRMDTRPLPEGRIALGRRQLLPLRRVALRDHWVGSASEPPLRDPSTSPGVSPRRSAGTVPVGPRPPPQGPIPGGRPITRT